MTRSLLKLSATAILILALAILIASACGYYLLQRQDRAQTRQDEATVARYVAQAVREVVLNQHRMMAQLARQPGVVQALQSDQVVDRQRKNEEFTALFTEGARLYITRYEGVEDEGLQPEYPALVHRLARTGERAITQYHAGSSGDAHVDLVEAVAYPSGEQLLGALILKCPVSALQQRLAAFAAGRFAIKLRQTNPLGEQEIFAEAGGVGDSDGATPYVLNIADTPWEVVIGSADPTPLLTLPLRWLAGFILAVLLAALAALGVILSRINRAARDDVASLVRMFNDIREGAVRVDYPMELSEFNSVFAYMRDSGRQLVQQQQRFRDLGLIDHLSQLHNRRAFEERLAELFKQSKTHSPSSVLMIDLDHFKAVNDQRGHDAGDALIVNFSQALKQRLRASDFLARLGGDEFCVIFAYTPLRQANALAQRLREELPRALPLLHGAEHSVRWTGGLSGMEPNDKKYDQVLWRADQALLRAKEAGRNQTFVYDTTEGLQPQQR